MDGRRLTILQVLPALDGGGVERGVLEIAEAVVKAGHRSLVVSAGGRMVQELVAGGTKHFRLPVAAKSPLSLRSVPLLRSLMIREKVDVVDIHSRLPGWLAWMAWRTIPQARRPRLITTLHGLHSVNAYSSIMCRGERVIAVSETARSYILKNFPQVPESRINVIPRGVDATEFARGYRPDPQWLHDFYGRYPEASGKLLITLPGRITRLKGHSDLLAMLDLVRTSDMPIHALIAGRVDDGKSDYVNELKKQVHAMQLADRVTLIGHRTDVREIYAISRVVLSLSQKPESFGRTVAESLSMGIPVVGYDHGGVGEILEAQFPAGRVPVGDVNCLADRVTKILNSSYPPRIAGDVFELSSMLDKTLQVYRDAVDCPDLKVAA